MATILVVDDCSDAREIFAMILRHTGHTVEIAAGGLRAIEYLREHRPALVFLDLHMPDVDGVEVLRTIRAEQRLRDLPVVVISGASQQEIERAKREGANECFVKGRCTLDDILTAVERYAGDGAAAAGRDRSDHA